MKGETRTCDACGAHLYRGLCGIQYGWMDSHYKSAFGHQFVFSHCRVLLQFVCDLCLVEWLHAGDAWFLDPRDFVTFDRAAYEGNVRHASWWAEETAATRARVSAWVHSARRLGMHPDVRRRIAVHVWREERSELRLYGCVYLPENAGYLWYGEHVCTREFKRVTTAITPEVEAKLRTYANRLRNYLGK